MNLDPTLRDAAIALENELRPADWLRTIGIGAPSGASPVLVVYVSRNDADVRRRVPKRWQACEVRVQLMGDSQPAG